MYNKSLKCVLFEKLGRNLKDNNHRNLTMLSVCSEREHNQNKSRKQHNAQSIRRLITPHWLWLLLVTGNQH